MAQAVAVRPAVQRDEVWAAPEDHPRVGLRGRSRERERLGRLLTGMRSGRSGVLVVRGEAGIGKTALLEQLVEQAAGCMVARATGVQADMELPFAGLQQLFGSMLGSLDRLPGPSARPSRCASPLSGRTLDLGPGRETAARTPGMSR